MSSWLRADCGPTAVQLRSNCGITAVAPWRKPTLARRVFVTADNCWKPTAARRKFAGVLVETDCGLLAETNCGLLPVCNCRQPSETDSSPTKKVVAFSLRIHCGKPTAARWWKPTVARKGFVTADNCWKPTAARRESGCISDVGNQLRPDGGNQLWPQRICDCRQLLETDSSPTKNCGGAGRNRLWPAGGNQLWPTSSLWLQTTVGNRQQPNEKSGCIFTCGPLWETDCGPHLDPTVGRV